MLFLTFWLGNVLRATTACTFSTSQLQKVLRTWCVLCILTSKFASRHNGVHFFDISTSKSAPNLVCFVHFDFEMCFAPQRHAIFQLSSGHMAPHLRFSEPTFRPAGATNHWNNAVFRDFATSSRACVFFLLTLSLLWPSRFCTSLLWLFPPLLFHLSILSEVWLLNFLRRYNYSRADGEGKCFRRGFWNARCPVMLTHTDSRWGRLGPSLAKHFRGVGGFLAVWCDAIHSMRWGVQVNAWGANGSSVIVNVTFMM